MLKEIAKRRTPEEPLILTARKVFYENAESASDVDLLALASVGYQAVLDSGGDWPVPPGVSGAAWPRSIPPSALAKMEAGLPHDQVAFDSFPSEDASLLAIVGLATIVGEHFMKADAGN
jgi:hypothetical protein